MGGFTRKITGTPNRKDVAAASAPLTADPAKIETKPIEPAPEQAAPKITDEPVQEAVQAEKMKNKRQRGRASTIFTSGSGIMGDDAGGTAKATLGA